MKKALFIVMAMTLTSAFAQHPDTKDFTQIMGNDLTGWMSGKGSKYDGMTQVEGKQGVGWEIKDGVLMWKSKGGDYIWTQERFSDFILDLEVKTKGNSGIFFRTDKPANPVQTGIELQIIPEGGPGENKNFAAFYDLQAPSKKVSCSFDKWHHITVTCKDNVLSIVVDGEAVNEMDINKWTEAGKNPDGSKNKYKTAIKDYVRDGHIGFQDHGEEVQYRNIRIQRLK